MCEPVSIMLAVGAVVGAASAAMQADGARRTAHQNQDAARANALNQYDQLGERQQDIAAQASDEANARNKEAVKQMGTLNAVFSDSGLDGNSQNRLYNEVITTNVQDQGTIDHNLNQQIKQTKQEAQGIRANAQSTINHAPIQSRLGVGLQIVGAGLSGYTGAGGKFTGN